MILAAPLLLAPLALVQDPGPVLDETGMRIDALVEREMRLAMIPGVALVVLEAGEVRKVAGYGLANLEHGVPVKPETVFQTASVGKQFTAAGILVLVQDGVVELDDPVSEHVGIDAPAWDGVTIRHLLTHTSGMGDYTRAVDYRRDYSDEELLEILGALEPASPPGERWRYSNTGYALLGLMMNVKLGRHHVEFLAERIFRPLGMETARGISDAAIVPNRSSGYRFVDGVLEHHDWVPPSLNATGDGCLYMTVLDFARWDAALRGDDVLKPASKRAMWAPAELNDGSTHPYGFGWGLGDVRGHRTQSHSGGWQGFSSHLVRFVERELTIVVLCNRAHADAQHLARGVAGSIDPELGPWIPETRELDRERAASAVGTYRIGGRAFEVTLEDSGLVLRSGDDRIELLPGQRDRYHTSDGATVRFRRPRDGRPTRLDAFGLWAER